MRLLNGMVFGLGLGLLTTSAAGLVGQYDEIIYIIGTVLLLLETGRLISTTLHFKKQQDQT